MTGPAQALPRQPEPQRRRPLRALGRGLLALALVLGVVGGCVAGWRWLSDPERFPLRAVRVDGPLRKVTQEELSAAIVPYLNTGMLGLDVKAIHRALEAIPWVAEAGVRRQWPGTLVLVIREREAVARWGERALLDAGSQVFAPAPETFPDGLPLLSGPERSEGEVWERFQRVRALLARIGQQPSELHLDARRSWRAVLADGTLLQLGPGEGEAALERFVRAYPKVSAPEGARIAQIDLRYPNGFALAWHAPAAASHGQERK